MLESEKTEEIKVAAAAEEVRQAASARDRANTRLKHSAATTSSPPAAVEFKRCVVFVDDDVALTSELQATLSTYGGYICREPHKCNFFLVLHPWQPKNPLITWAAALKGAWVLTPTCFLCKPGASIKYKPAIFMKRHVWVSEVFQQENLMHWITLLEILNAHPGIHLWKMMAGPAEWAALRAKRETQKRTAEVLAIVGINEHMPGCGTLCLESATQFFASSLDKSRGSLGLLNM